MIRPVPGVIVRRSDSTYGVVQRTEERDATHAARVIWRDNPGHARLEPVTTLAPAVDVGSDVVHVPAREEQSSLGHGVVQATRTVGGQFHALVEFWLRTERTWVPWQYLVHVPSVAAAYQRHESSIASDAERFRLRNLAFALERWHANTGALSRLDIDPLPHQIHVAHKILTSGNLNWLIADDVGLGKTVEVGLIVSALRSQRRQRFLFVVPAGLTRQWKEELSDKFDMADTFIYGDDFRIDDPRQWKSFDRVIVSIDRIKAEEHLERFLQTDPWDLIVFDEAHRLGRDEKGAKYTSTDRFRAAASLRQHTDAVLLLTGTPHQGKDDRFRALLELLRPGDEWRRRFQRLRQDPGLLGDIVIRNRKADVTQADGTFIFRGKDVRTVEVPTSEGAADFDRALRAYLRSGYGAAKGSDMRQRAIGFVMTTYRKLASSSYAAIHRALARRAARLRGEALQDDPRNLETSDERYVEADEFKLEEVESRNEFFSGESDQLRPLIDMAAGLAEEDAKVRWLLDDVIAGLRTEQPNGKLLIFTEYRTTQEHLKRAIETHHGEGSVAMIHGGQSMQARRSQIDAFHATSSFMISTEAGAEGINLQRACHVMVNYDLPWNPMRLVQRIGRLYRYGQEKRVQVINLKSPGSADDAILAKMYDRLEEVAKDMAAVSDFADGRDGLQDDILGSLVGNLDLDVAEVLAKASEDEERTQARIEEALTRAQEATRHQDDLLRHASGFDPNDLAHDLPLGVDHVKAFAEAGFKMASIDVTSRLYGDDVWEVRLPEALRSHLGTSTNMRIAFSRHAARQGKGASVFGPDHALFRLLFNHVTNYDRASLVAAVDHIPGRMAMTALLRWMDAIGRPVRDDYVAAVLRSDGSIDLNPPEWADYLRDGAARPPLAHEPDDNSWLQLERTLHDELQRRATRTTHPDAPYTLGVALLAQESS